MSFQLQALENGIKVTTKLRHLGRWLEASLARVFQDAARSQEAIFLDLGCVLYVDEAIRRLIHEARSQNQRIQLVGYPRGLTGGAGSPEVATPQAEMAA